MIRSQSETAFVMLSNRIRAIYAGVAVTILALPAIAMRVTDGVDWTVSDFVAAAVLLTAVGLGIELASRLPARRGMRIGALALVAVLGAAAWVDAAVGILPSGGLLGGS